MKLEWEVGVRDEKDPGCETQIVGRGGRKG